MGGEVSHGRCLGRRRRGRGSRAVRGEGAAAGDPGPHGPDRDVERRRRSPRSRGRRRRGARPRRGSPRGAAASAASRSSRSATTRRGPGPVAAGRVRRVAPGRGGGAARRTSSSAAFTAMRCDQVVNAARPSKRVMQRVIDDQRLLGGVERGVGVRRSDGRPRAGGRRGGRAARRAHAVAVDGARDERRRRRRQARVTSAGPRRSARPSSPGGSRVSQTRT